MNTFLAYFDETGDDGVTTASSEHFVLTSLYMPANDWLANFDALKNMRKELRAKYGLHISEEFHTKHFLTDKSPYREYCWSHEQRREILKTYTLCLAGMNISTVNVIIDKTKFINSNYKVLEKALTYNIQRIENDSSGNWNYIILSDKGRISPMSSTARKIRAYNPIPSQFGNGYNRPIKGLIEDVLEKDSRDSYFIQSADFISYFAHLYFLVNDKHKQLPNRVGRLIDKDFIGSVFAILKNGKVINLRANPSHDYGFVIYPK